MMEGGNLPRREFRAGDPTSQFADLTFPSDEELAAMRQTPSTQ